MTLRAATLFAGLLIPACTSKTAASDDPPCKCEPVLSYRVTTTDGSSEARVIGHPVSVRVDQRTLMQVPPLRAKQTLSSLVPDPDPMSQP